MNSNKSIPTGGSGSGEVHSFLLVSRLVKQVLIKLPEVNDGGHAGPQELSGYCGSRRSQVTMFTQTEAVAFAGSPKV